MLKKFMNNVLINLLKLKLNFKIIFKNLLTTYFFNQSKLSPSTSIIDKIYKIFS